MKLKYFFLIIIFSKIKSGIFDSYYVKKFKIYNITLKFRIDIWRKRHIRNISKYAKFNKNSNTFWIQIFKSMWRRKWLYKKWNLYRAFIRNKSIIYKLYNINEFKWNMFNFMYKKFYWRWNWNLWMVNW